MFARTVLPLTLWFAVIGDAEQARGQFEERVQPKSNIAVRPASLPSSQSVVNARRDVAENLQIRVTVQYLMVDSETRASIYQGLNPQQIQSSLQRPGESERINLDESTAPLAAFQQIHAPSRVTCYTLSQQEFAQVLKKVVDSKRSEINVAPKVILLDGNEVEMTDLVQRPFIVDFHATGDSVEPKVHVMDEGTRLRLAARLSPFQPDSSQPVDLRCELTVMQMLDVKSDQVFGLDDEPIAVQIPIQQVTTAVASRTLAVGQTFLIDPHLSRVKDVTNENGIPILSKLP